MRLCKELSKRKIDTKGYTLIELIAVLVILGVIALIAIPSVARSIENAKEEVCNSNRLEINQSYKLHLQINEIVHSDTMFTANLLEIDGTPCPEGGELVYQDGVILCSIHSNENEHDHNEENDEVPFL